MELAIHEVAARKVATREIASWEIRNVLPDGGLPPDPEAILSGVACESKTLTLNMQTPERSPSTHEQPGPSPLIRIILT